MFAANEIEVDLSMSKFGKKKSVIHAQGSKVSAIFNKSFNKSWINNYKSTVLVISGGENINPKFFKSKNW